MKPNLSSATRQGPSGPAPSGALDDRRRAGHRDAVGDQPWEISLNMLARAGLHVARTTIRRLLKKPPATQRPEPPTEAAPATPSPESKPRRIVSRRPNHTWLIDLTIVPTTSGFWVPWLPFTMAQRWPFCWWVAIVLDHFSRGVVGRAVFKQQPSAADVVRVVEAARKQAGGAPKYIITDKGAQFGERYRAWCKKRGVRPRYGAVGKYGSIALIERFMRTLKDEGLRHILVPLRLRDMEAEVDVFIAWYNGFRPHSGLGGATPNEVFHGRQRAREGPRFEVRGRYPVPRGAKLRATKGTVVALSLGRHEGRPHLPVVRLRSAA
jgi:putative transposase